MSNEVKKGLRIHWRYRQFKASLFANGLFYFLGRIPLLGKIIPTTMLYGDYTLKKLIAYIKLVTFFLFELVKVVFPFIISLLISKIINEATGASVSIFFVWFVLAILLGQFTNQLFPTLKKQEIQYIKSFHISKITYLKSGTLLRILLSSLFYIPVLLVVGFIENNPVLYVLIGFFSYVSFSFIYSVLNLHLTLVKRRRLTKFFVLLLGYAFITGLIIYSAYHGQLDRIQTMIVSWEMALFSLILSVPSLYLYVHFKRFDDYGKQLIKSSETMISQNSTSSHTQKKYFGEGQKMQQSMKIEKERFDHLSGSAYLNALLFSRFRGTLRKQLLITVGIISTLMIILIVVTQYLSLFKADNMDAMFYGIIPSMFFFMYIASFGKRVVQTVFINCDSSMLSYPFYRESRAIVKGFFYRFFKVLYYNGIVAFTFVFWVLVFNFTNHRILSNQTIGVFIFVMISLTVLFSFHDLFVYYLLQPFTSELEVVNPVYKIIDYVFYLFSYINLQVHTAGIGYALLISGVSIVYVIVGLVIIVKVSPKTFKLKK